MTVPQLLKKFLAFYGSRTFSSVSTRARRLPLPRARWIQSTTFNHTSLRSILLLSFHVVSSVQVSWPTIFDAFLISPMHAICLPISIPWFYHPDNTFAEAYKFQSSTLCSFLQPPILLQIRNNILNLVCYYSCN